MLRNKGWDVKVLSFKIMILTGLDYKILSFCNEPNFILTTKILLILLSGFSENPIAQNSPYSVCVQK